MTIQFCGAARTVTGSSHLITLDDGYKILLDCGLYQGHDKDFEEFNSTWHFKPNEIDCVILSHAHIDHAGRLPRLVRDGFSGHIIATHATRDLSAIMLLDSANIQERDAQYLNKKAGRYEYGKAKPLYTVKDIAPCINRFWSIGYDDWYPINDNVEVLLLDSGHILGSASVTLRIKKEDGETMTIGFSGDIGRPNRPILRDPVPMPPCDYLICESTYGGRQHRSAPDEQKTLLQIIRKTCMENRGKLIIPAFSVGRTQEIVYMLDVLETDRWLPQIPVYVDSPLAINATQVFLSHPECFDKEILEYMLTDTNPFGFNDLNYVRRLEGSKQINKELDPCIIISASGMITAGRVKHHVFHNIEDSSNTILMVGYCSPHTLGGQLQRGKEEVKIFGQTKKVAATIERMSSFSAHGDEQEMIDFLSNQNKEQLQKIFLVHGNYERQQLFQQTLEKEGFNEVVIPKLKDKVVL